MFSTAAFGSCCMSAGHFWHASLSLLLQALVPVPQPPLHGSLRLLVVHNSLGLLL